MRSSRSAAKPLLARRHSPGRRWFVPLLLGLAAFAFGALLAGAVIAPASAPMHMPSIRQAAGQPQGLTDVPPLPTTFRRIRSAGTDAEPTPRTAPRAGRTP
jgi:hypothetical protein